MMRIVIRQEGEYVNAYLARMHTLDDAVHLGSLKSAICQSDAIAWRRFQELMQHIAGVASERAAKLEPVNGSWQ